MKSLFIGLFLMLSAAFSLVAQWSEYSTSPTKSDISIIQSISNQELIILTTDGEVYKSDNNGLAWTPVSTSSIAILHLVWSEDYGVGYYYDSDGNFYRSSNSANSWNMVNHFSNFVSFQIIDSTAGLLRMTANTYSITFDGGLSFTDIDISGLGYIEQMLFISRDIGFALTECLLKTNNGGLSFDTIPVQGIIESFPTALFFSNNQQGWLFTELTSGNHQFLSTNNQGTNWSPVSVQEMFTPNQVHWYDSFHIVVEDGGAYYETLDGGTSYTIYNCPFGKQYTLFRNNEIWVVGKGDLIAKTTDFIHWEFVASSFVPLEYSELQTPVMGLITYSCLFSPFLMLKQPNSSFFNQIAPFGTLRDTSRIVDYRVINEDTMLVSGSLGEVLKSTDGGVNWESIFESPQSAYVAQIELRPDQTGFAIIKADSGGLYNYHLYSISNNALQWDYIFNLDQNPGYLQLLEDQTVIISNLPNNQLMISVDNGQNWTTASAPVSTNKTYFINDSVGIIYSNSYPDYITVNSGADWNTISSLGKKILAVQFVNNQQGIAICYDGLYKTQDQGQSWYLEYPYSFNTLLPSFISYANDTAAYVLGFDENNGEAFLLTSYGLQWIKEPISIAKLNVYPNPAKDIITLDLNDYLGNLNYQLFNLTGQKVGEGRILGNSIPIASLAKGFYTLYIQSDNQLKYTAKFEKL